MKRQIIFDFDGTHYVLKEDSEVVFTIEATELKFSALDFYNGIYSKNRSSNIELINAVVSAEKKSQGGYIHSWLSDIICSIQRDLGDSEQEVQDSMNAVSEDYRIIPLFDMAACAGDGFYLDESIPSKDYLTDNVEATFAVRISGKSMEPTILDESIILVKKVDELAADDIGIFVLDGTVMCKRYKVVENEVVLYPDNTSSEFKEFRITEDTMCTIQGRVVGIENGELL